MTGVYSSIHPRLFYTNQGILSMVIASNVEEIIRRFVDLATVNLRLEAVYLFGSNAKGNTEEWSDIDLAIVSPDFSGDSFEDSKKTFSIHSQSRFRH
ncbi:MAG: nucleotidyltransferase domain-containing protein [candidate division KSB1 bacterium]|nr:nucleotidyltransferase domain-containing protein [candidate division KSB1 bacterium]